MADTDTPVATPSVEDLQKRIAELEAKSRVDSAITAALHETVGKLRTILVTQAQENYQRVQEIVEVAEMRIAKARGGA